MNTPYTNLMDTAILTPLNHSGLESIKLPAAVKLAE